jgi:hypothetical protein
MTKASQPRKLRLEHINRDTAHGYEIIRRVVFGIKPNGFAKFAADRLRASGYEIAFAPSAEDARRSAVGRVDTAVVVPLATEAEGGFLTMAKIVTALPTAKVILVAPAADERISQFAEFIDAKIAFETDGPEALFAAVMK